MKIVITGGIGTGKSSVAKIFKELGYKVIDADIIAHNVLENSKDDIRKLFGKELIKNGKIDRKKLGSIVFNDSIKKRELENLLHPKIRKKIIDETKKLESQNKKYILDIPLFYESKGYSADKVVVVYAPKELQIKRVMQRDGLNYNEALKRVESQIDIEKKKELADIVIKNTKDIKSLEKEVRKIDANFKI